MLSKKEFERILSYTKENLYRAEEYLISKKKMLDENPDSILYQGLVKNSTEYIEDLRNRIVEYQAEILKLENK